MTGSCCLTPGTGAPPVATAWAATPAVAPTASAAPIRSTLLLDAEAADVGQPVVERRHRVPEIPLGAADARMPGADRPAGPAVPLEDRAGREGRRALAAHVVEAPRPCGRPRRRTPRRTGRRRSWPGGGTDRGSARRRRRAGGPSPSSRGEAAEGQEVHHGGGDHVADRGAAGDVHDRLVLDDRRDAHRPGGIRARPPARCPSARRRRARAPPPRPAAASSRIALAVRPPMVG